MDWRLKNGVMLRIIYTKRLKSWTFMNDGDVYVVSEIYVFKGGGGGGRRRRCSLVVRIKKMLFYLVIYVPKISFINYNKHRMMHVVDIG